MREKKSSFTLITPVIRVPDLLVCERCPRCFWRAITFDQPAERFPGVVSHLHEILRQFRDEHRAEDPNKPFHHFEGAGKTILAPQYIVNWLRSVIAYFDEQTGALLAGRFDDCLFNVRRRVYVPLLIKIVGKFHDRVEDLDLVRLGSLALLLRENGLRSASTGVVCEYLPADDVAWTRNRRILTAPARASSVQKLFRRGARIARLLKPPKAAVGCKLCEHVATIAKFE